LNISNQDKTKSKKSYSEESENNSKSQTKNDDFISFDKEKKIKNEDEDLGGYLKGKISNINNSEEENNSILDEENNYDNSEKEKKNISNIDLELLLNDTEKNRKISTDPNETHQTHDGTIDHINDDMTGKTKGSDEINL